MKRGQTAFINLASKILVSLTGFAANWYIARELGSEILGTYLLIISVISWMILGGNAGIPIAVKKRISEHKNSGEALSTGFALQILILLALLLFTFLAQEQLRNYIGVDVLAIFSAILVIYAIHNFSSSTLVGQQKVHIQSLSKSINTTIRSVTQIGLIFFGLGIGGLLWGYLGGLIVSLAISLFYIDFNYTRPTVNKAADIFSYAKYSWVTAIKSRTFAAMDTILLGFFVTKDLIGVYGIAWNVASVLALFAGSISATLFPEISSLSSKGDFEQIGSLLEDGLSYAGLFVIPGLAGAAILGDTILSIYGPEFVKGYSVLIILILAQLLYTFEVQFTNALDAIDRPDLTFRITITFVLVNVFLNIVLISLVGWYGAAIATTVSSGISAILGYKALSNHLQFAFPVRELSKQCLATMIMAGIVFMGITIFGETILTTLVLVVVGASSYIFAMLVISPQFRKTVSDNVPERGLIGNRL
ncbi:polysaccharide biosynthesis C-terminal domain-containing protein [Halobaculum limi]|uniref:oligosaccharide flippase family protein n=1 Tax=Halobaculum limi TaxID=3031916 RepID=UPI00240579B0|nr:polysaccharide biosynthesis C-terminal domain-containing protein [Halobaculum sp. YSMS11]